MPGYSSKVPYSWEVRKKYIDLPFPESEYHARIEKIKKQMEKNNIDDLLVFGNTLDRGDLAYLSNFYPFGKTALILRNEQKDPVIITEGILHGEPMNSYIWTSWVRDFRPVHHEANEFGRAIADVLREDRVKTVGIVGMDNIPITTGENLKSSLKGTRWLDFWYPFTSVKSIRSLREVSLLKQVGQITAEGMKAAIESIREGKTEHEIVAVANRRIFELGAHDLFFPTIVNSGPRSGIKHSYPTNRRIRRGDMIYLDMGASRYNYNSDMSRTVVVGGANSEQKQVLDVVLDGYNRLTAMMKPGISSERFIQKAGELEQKSGLSQQFKGRIFVGLAVHHAVGTSIAEFPTMGFQNTILKENMTFAFEPMAHILDFGTAVIENMILITRNGAESITPYENVHW